MKYIKLLIFFMLISLFTLPQEKLTFSVHNFPPYVLLDKDDNPYGAFIDIVKEASKIANIDYEVTYFPNRRSKSLLEKGVTNGNFPLGWNLERDSWLYWTPPLMLAEYGFYIQTFGPNFMTLEDFSGKTIGVFGPSNTSFQLYTLNDILTSKGYAPMLISMLPNENGQSLIMLSKNKLDAVFINKKVGEYLIENLKIENLTYSLSIKELNYYAGFSKEKNSKKLIDKFNNAIIKLKDSGRLEEILLKYNFDMPKEDIK